MANSQKTPRVRWAVVSELAEGLNPKVQTGRWWFPGQWQLEQHQDRRFWLCISSGPAQVPRGLSCRNHWFSPELELRAPPPTCSLGAALCICKSC